MTVAAPPSFAGFHRIGPAAPTAPVVLSVPHAGRDYPADLLAAARVPRSGLELLEDRHADRLIDSAVAAGATAFVATRPRSWIDLNRAEGEIDPAMIDPPPRADRLVASAKVRGGLGLVPRRLHAAGDLWRGRLPAATLDHRIASHHRPWHGAIAAALAEAHARFGVALLLDCHSMPPLRPQSAARPPRVVIGDRHGRTAPALLVDRLVAIAEGAGLTAARNSPYAGGHALDRQARPASGIYAIQIEVDRSLYLDEALRECGPGLADMQAIIATMVAAMIEELSIPIRHAAE